MGEQVYFKAERILEISEGFSLLTENLKVSFSVFQLDDYTFEHSSIIKALEHSCDTETIVLVSYYFWASIL